MGTKYTGIMTNKLYKKLTVLYFWCLTGLLMLAHNGYAQDSLRISLSGCSDCSGEMEITAWKAARPYSFMKAPLTNGEVRTVLPESLPDGIGNMSLKVEFGEVNIPWADKSTDEPIVISMSPVGGYQVEGAPVSNKLLAMQRKADSLKNAIRELTPLMMSFRGFGALSDTLDKAYQEMITAMDNWYNSQELNSLPPLVHHYLQSSRSLVLDPELPPEAQWKAATDAYFTWFNPHDTSLLNTDLYASRLEEFLSIYAGKDPTNPSAVNEGIDIWLGMLRDSDSLTQVSAKVMQSWLRRQSLDESVRYIDQEYLANLCQAEDDSLLQQRLEVYERIGIGKKLPDFQWTDESGKTQSLYAQNGKEILVVFWATWCSHCAEALPHLYALTEQKPDLTVVAIALDSDEQAWNDHKKLFPTWHHVRAPGQWDDPLARMYGIFATPQFFLTDKNKVLKKKASEIKDLWP